MNALRPLTVLALLGCVVLPVSPAHAACDVTVSSFAFTPEEKTVPAGTTVQWCWTGDNHSVTADDGSFDSGVKNTGDKFPRAITKTVSYHCSVHGGMTGTIRVQATQASKTPTPTPKPTTASPTASRTTPPPTRTTTTPPPAPRTILPSPTPTPTPTPVVTTTPPGTTPAATATSPTQSPAALEIDPAPAKPKTGLAIVVALLVAAAGLGGAAWLFLRTRAG